MVREASTCLHQERISDAQRYIKKVLAVAIKDKSSAVSDVMRLRDIYKRSPKFMKIIEEEAFAIQIANQNDSMERDNTTAVSTTASQASSLFTAISKDEQQDEKGGCKLNCVNAHI